MTQFMKVITFAFLATAVSACVLVAQSNPENPKFTIVISADKPEVTLGADITIAFTITNIRRKRSVSHVDIPGGCKTVTSTICETSRARLWPDSGRDIGRCPTGLCSGFLTNTPEIQALVGAELSRVDS